MSTSGKEPTSDIAPPGPKDTGSSTFPAQLGMVACLVLAALFLIKPVRRHLNGKEAVRVVDQIKQLADSYRYDEAYVALQTAIELAHDRLEVVQAAADLLTRREDPAALGFWQTLIQARKATQEDRTRLVELAIKLGRIDIASAVLAELRKEDPSSAELKYLEVRLKLQMEESAGANALAQDWMSKNPEQEAAQFTLGWVRMHQSTTAAREEGRRLLMAVANGKSAWRSKALMALSEDQDLNRAELQVVVRAFESLQNPSPEQQMRLASLKVRLDASKRLEVVNSMVDWGKTLDTFQLMPLANWMELHDALNAVPKILPIERVRTNANLLMVRLQTLAWLGETVEVEQHLSDGGTPIDPLQRQIIRSTVATRKKPPEDPIPALHEALKLAGTNSVMMVNIAKHAVRLHQTNAAIDIYAQLAAKPTHTSSATAEILRLLEESQPSREIRDRLRKISKELPEVSPLLIEACYFDILLGENVRESRSQLNVLAVKNAESLRIRLSLALADLVEKQPQNALARLGNDSMAWTRAAPRWQAIRVAILGHNGKTDQAKAAAKTIDPSRLRAEEAAWIRPWQ